jgi:hypothetical protein
MRVEHRVREKIRFAAKRRTDYFHEILRDILHTENFEQRQKAAGCFVKGNSDRVLVELAEVDPAGGSAGENFIRRPVPQPDPHRVKKRPGMNRVAGLIQRSSQLEREAVDAFCDPAQSFRTMIDGIHRSHNREKNLRGADVARGLFATDMLLARLEREAQCRISGGIF